MRQGAKFGFYSCGGVWLVWVGVRGKMPALRYKSQGQELNLSGSKDKPSLTFTVLRPSKVVYKGFITLSARKAIKFGVGPEPIATREHRE
jgi:hypothetical protein